MQDVGVYLKGLRDARQLSQGDAAALIGVDAKTIERWEAGKNEPKFSVLGLYVEKLAGSLEYAIKLLTGKDVATAGGMAAHGVNPQLLELLEDLEPEEIDLFLALAERMRRPRSGR